jgi:signal transduction histidine kinase
MKAASLRWRLVLLAACSIVAALTVAGLSLGWLFERHIERRVTHELSIRLEELLGAFTLEAGTPKLNRVLSDPRYDQPLSGSYWQISDTKGPVLQSRSLWDQTLALRDRPSSDVKAYEIHGADDTILYALDHRVVMDNGGQPRTFRVAVAVDHAEIDAMNQAFIGDVVKALAAIGLALLVGSWLQINLGLRPLSHLRRRLAAIREGRSSHLDGYLPAEVAPLAEDFNTLLFRHAESLRKARERAGSLAHGLKTPLTILAGEARRLDDRGMNDAAAVLREQIAMMRSHVERELARARSHGSATLGELHTDARKSVERLMDLVRRLPRGRELNFVNALPEGLNLQIDADDFGEIIGNLLDNARKYALHKVTVFAECVGGHATIFVDDDGPGIPKPMRERLALRGERANDHAEGSGLGLAIVLDLLADYGADLTINDNPHGGCRALFSLRGVVNTPDEAPSAPARPNKMALQD